MDDEDYLPEQSWWERLEDWALEENLHIWYLVISAVAVCVLLLIIDREATKGQDLSRKIIDLQAEIQSNEGKILNLKADMEAQRQAYLMPKEQPKKAADSADKAASKVNEKITKVQDALIDKVQQPKVITKVETTVVTIPVNKELNNIMFESYCSTVPDSPQCRKVKK